MRLLERVALVTGGARGIGEGVARCLIAEGARVGIVDLDGAQTEETASNLGESAIGVCADAADQQSIAAATERVVAELGGLDILVNNAGGAGAMTNELGPSLGFAGLTQELWDAQLVTNLRTAFAASHAAIPHLKRRGGGAIVNIASIAALMPSVAIPAYGAAKAGVVQLTKTLALDLAPSNIRVNAICPGFLWTKAWETMATAFKSSVPEYNDLEPKQIFHEVVKQGVPLGREQTPEDIGKLVVFLASDDALNITGQEIKVDGGITLKMGAG